MYNRKNIIVFSFGIISAVFALCGQLPNQASGQQMLQDGFLASLFQAQPDVREEEKTNGKKETLSKKAKRACAQCVAAAKKKLIEIKEKVDEFRETRFGNACEYALYTALIGVLFNKVKQRFEQSAAVTGTTETATTTFADIGGYDDVKKNLKLIIDLLKDPKKFAHLGITSIPHTLLYGPPGTAKSLFAAAAAGEAGLPFMLVNSSELTKPYMGDSAGNVKRLFDKARDEFKRTGRPTIIYFEEFDAVGSKRVNSSSDTAKERANTVAQLLVEIDGAKKDNKSFFVIFASTNRKESLDDALIRGLRIDNHIYVGLPNVNARNEILKTHSKKYPLASDVNLQELAQMTTGYSGADIASLLRKGACAAAKEDRKHISAADLKTIIKEKTKPQAAGVDSAPADTKDAQSDQDVDPNFFINILMNAAKKNPGVIEKIIHKFLELLGKSVETDQSDEEEEAATE